MRPSMTSRSDWANDSSTPEVGRRMPVIVLKLRVTETNETLATSKVSTGLAKPTGEPVDLVGHRDIDATEREVGKQLFKAVRFRAPPGYPPSS